jgi:hypothetical protein
MGRINPPKRRRDKCHSFWLTEAVDTELQSVVRQTGANLGQTIERAILSALKDPAFMDALKAEAAAEEQRKADRQSKPRREPRKYAPTKNGRAKAQPPDMSPEAIAAWWCGRKQAQATKQ